MALGAQRRLRRQVESHRYSIWRKVEERARFRTSRYDPYSDRVITEMIQRLRQHYGLEARIIKAIGPGYTWKVTIIRPGG